MSPRVRGELQPPYWRLIATRILGGALRILSSPPAAVAAYYALTVVNLSAPLFAALLSSVCHQIILRSSTEFCQPLRSSRLRLPFGRAPPPAHPVRSSPSCRAATLPPWAASTSG